MNTYISPTILSNAFGVSPSTLKRWSDKGILKSDRTRGGHRRFSISEAIKMSRDLGIPFRNPESIGLPEPIEPSGLIGGREPFEILTATISSQRTAP
ncbi:MAG: MerR family DNA-binding transcriptional regulator, partial [Planctomycetota bacterium]